MSPLPGAASNRPPGGRLAALIPGLLGGLAIAKFGNPVILDGKVLPPANLAEVLSDPWPNRWGQWLVLAMALVLLPASLRTRAHRARVVPIPVLSGLAVWLAWQFVAAATSVDGTLTALVLPHFLATTACFLTGAWVVGRAADPRWLWLGLGLGLAFCLVRGTNQHFVGFRQDLQTLTQGEATAWKDYPPETLEAMRQSGLIVRTNGVDIANPLILAKLNKGRIHGTLVYPNALAGLLLLLLPAALTLIRLESGILRPPLRHLVTGLAALLGIGCFYWTGSKAGWLIAIGMAVLALWRMRLPARWKVGATLLVALTGLAIFTLRFSGYLAGGATSAAARIDYWRAAAQVAREHPAFGSGPGTFQRPYARLKQPESEMARLVHNDYLEQFSDAGVVSGTAYLVFAAGLLASVWRRWSRPEDPLRLAVTLGLTGWFLQGAVEFGLYIPGTAWPAFLLAGWMAGSAPEKPSTPPVAPANTPATE